MLLRFLNTKTYLIGIIIKNKSHHTAYGQSSSFHMKKKLNLKNHRALPIAETYKRNLHGFGTIGTKEHAKLASKKQYFHR